MQHNLISKVMLIVQILGYFQIFTITQDPVINLFVQKAFLSMFLLLPCNDYQEVQVQEVWIL